MLTAKDVMQSYKSLTLYSEYRQKNQPPVWRQTTTFEHVDICDFEIILTTDDKGSVLIIDADVKVHIIPLSFGREKVILGDENAELLCLIGKK